MPVPLNIPQPSPPIKVKNRKTIAFIFLCPLGSKSNLSCTRGGDNFFVSRALPSLPAPNEKFLVNRDLVSVLSPTGESNLLGKLLVHDNNKEA